MCAPDQAKLSGRLGFAALIGWLSPDRPEPPVLAYTKTSLLSSAYSLQARANCLCWFIHIMPWAFCLALVNAGRSIAAKIAMIAMTTSNSIKVKARLGFGNLAAALFWSWVSCIDVKIC